MTVGKPYQRSQAEALLKPVDDGQSWVIDDRGVWPDTDFKAFDAMGGRPEYNVLSWRPVMVFKDDRPAPHCKNTPALPFPFDAGDLAAFMLEGTGSFVADYYGSWEHGPDEDALDEIDPVDNYARQAVRDAYDAYRAAIQKVGEFEYELQSRADALQEEYREEQRKAKKKANLKDLPHVSVDGGEAYRRAREQALEPLAGKKAALERARADAEGAHQRWLRAMVEELLKAKPGMAEEPFPFTSPEAIQGVVVASVKSSASRMPAKSITTAQVAVFFDGLPYAAENWTKRLSDTKWLWPARLALGAAGGGTGLWCPLKLAQAIHGKARGGEKQKTLEALNKRFKNNPVLEPWRADWSEHYDMFNDVDVRR